MKKHVLFGGGAVVLALSLVAGCAPASQGTGEDKTLVLGATPGTGSLDVAIANLWYDRPAAQAVYDALFSWDQDTDSYGEFLSTGWEVSDDRLTLSIDLRDDVTFSDGEKLTPESAINSLQIHTFYFSEWQLEVTGEHSIALISPTPMGTAPMQNITGIAMFSPAFTPEELAEAPVGSGPYLLDAENSTIGVELHFTRNPDYWGDPADFAYDELTVKIYEDNVAAVNALKSGQIDATLVDIGTVPDLESAGYSLTIGSAIFYGLQLGDLAGEIQPAIGDARVRQAINMAFDRETINDALAFGYGEPSAQAFIDVQPEYIEGADDYYSYDPEGAKALLAEAGYPDGFDLEIATLLNATTLVEPIIQQSLADIGIRVTYNTFPDFGAFLAGAAESPAIVLGFYYINTIKGNLRPDAAFNVWGFTVPGGEDLFDKIELGSEEESAAASQELGRIVLEEALFAPIYRVPVVWASIPEVTLSLDKLSAPVRLKTFKPTN